MDRGPRRGLHGLVWQYLGDGCPPEEIVAPDDDGSEHLTEGVGRGTQDD